MNELMNKFKDVFTSVLNFIGKIKTRIKEKTCCLSKGCFRSISFVEIICWAVLVSTLFFVLTFVLPDFRQQKNKHIGVVNITGIIDEFVKTQAKKELPREEVKKRVQNFGKTLEKILYEVGDKNKAVLMPSEAVIVGAIDYTQEVQKHLSLFMSELSQKQLMQENKRQKAG